MGYIEVIFDHIIRTSAMASVLVFIILLAKWLIKDKVSVNWHYYIWFLLIIKLLIPYSPESSLSIYNVFNPSMEKHYINHNYSFKGKENSIDEKNNNAKVVLNQNEIIHNENNNDNNINFKIYIIAIWLLGILIFTSYIAIINYRFYSKLKINYKINNEVVNEFFNECRQIMNINNTIPILYAEAIQTPCIFGFFKPKLLIPSNLAEKISSDELKHIFFHELSHLRRKDIAINWIIILLKILHWFNPIIWYGFYKMDDDCEIACDDLALSYINQEKRSDYGYTLINLLNMISKSQRIPGTTGMALDKSQIKRRIIRISKLRIQSLKWAMVGMILFLSIGLITLTNAKNEIKYNDLQEKLKISQIINGEVDVEGSGIIITINNDNWGIMKYNEEEIYNIINKLNGMGAEAISINDKRVNLVSNRKQDFMEGYNGKLVIKAIGDSKILDKMLKPLDNYPIKLSEIDKLKKMYDIDVKIEKANKLFIPKYKENTKFKYAKTVKS